MEPLKNNSALENLMGGIFMFVFTIKMSQRSQCVVHNYSWHIKSVIRIYR